MENNMNRGRYYPNNKYKDWLILTEWNSGFSDHVYHKKLTDFIYSSWKEILNDIPEQNETFKELGEFDNLRTIKTGAILQYSEKFNGKTPLEIGAVVIPSKQEKNKHKRVAIFGAGIRPDDKNIMICALQVNEEVSPNQALQKDSYLRELAAHETVHIIKHFHSVSQKYADEFSKEGKLDVSAYLRDKNEIDAYITQINEELRSIHGKYPNMVFSDAIKLSDTYVLYKNKIFSYVDKVKNKILSKCLHFWITELNGKIK